MAGRKKLQNAGEPALDFARVKVKGRGMVSLSWYAIRQLCRRWAPDEPRSVFVAAAILAAHPEVDPSDYEPKGGA
jgi:hypothetical protein